MIEMIRAKKIKSLMDEVIPIQLDVEHRLSDGSLQGDEQIILGYVRVMGVTFRRLDEMIGQDKAADGRGETTVAA